MPFVYVLRSLKNGRFYIGSTKNLGARLAEHNRGKTKSIKAYMPFELVYQEEYSNQAEARKRESQLKRQKSKKYIEKLIRKRGLV